MKIAVDARELEGRRTGVGRYLHELLRAFSRHPAGRTHQFVLCTTRPLDVTPYDGLHVTAVHAAGRGVAWEQLTLPRLVARERPDLLFAPGYTAPLTMAIPTVLVVHDVSFVSHPEWFSWREGARRRTITRLSARRAAAIVTVSQFSKGEIESHLGVPPRRVVVIPNGVTRLARRTEGAANGNILFVGSVFNRRNVPPLIDAVALLAQRRPSIRLDVVGDNRTSPYLDLDTYARTAGAGDHVTLRAYVADDELAGYYERAGAFAFLSEYEGFGLTPLEALSAGVPIVVLDRPATREVYGDAGIYVTEPQPAAIADALDAALFNEAERQRVLQAADALLDRYTWSRAAASVLEVFERVGAAVPAGAARA